MKKIMASVIWTDEQQAAIDKKGSNILVAAAAGSGKTAVLVERIIKKIIVDRVDIDKILVVTFTNAAASEMRERILEAIYKKIEENQASGIGFSCEEESISEWDEDQKLRFEKEALGFFLTSHPLQPYRHELNRLDLRPLEDCREMADKATIKCAVLVTSIREILNKRGNRMAFVAGEDLTASGEVTFFTEELNASRDLLNSEQPLLLTATIDNRESSSYSPDSDDDSDDEAPVKEIKLRGGSVQALNDACSASDAPISWELDPRRLSSEGMESLKAILERHKGNTA